MVGLYPRMHLKRTVTGNKRKYKKWLPLERKGGERERETVLPLFWPGGGGHTTGYARSFPTRDQT